MSALLSNDPAGTVATSGVVEAMLRETARLLAALAADADFVGAIDLRSLSLDESEYARLRAQLGRGEVLVTIGSAGASQITETGYAGVWWMRLAGDDERVLLEQIVVARVPPLVPAHTADVAAAARRMESDLRAPALPAGTLVEAPHG